MKPTAIRPARIEWDDQGVAHAPDFGDVYHSRSGALAQARHVFLAGNDLPARWADRPRYVVLETGFGLGHNFLATWMAWRADPRRCDRLVYVSVEKHPLKHEDLRRTLEAGEAGQACPELVQALLSGWPEAIPEWHLRDFDGGHVQLHLGLGEATDLLRGLQAEVDALYLDGFAPSCNEAMWNRDLLQRLARLAAPECTAATWSAARRVRDGLSAAGFTVSSAPGFAAKRDMTVARYAPRYRTPAPAAFRVGSTPSSGSSAPPRVGTRSHSMSAGGVAREALVIGAGLAGCATAWALARQGWSSTVIDSREAPAQLTSGNPGGLMHPIFNAPDSLHARWFRAAAGRTAALATPAIRSGEVAGRLEGFLRLEGRLDRERAEARLAAVGLPANLVRWMEPAEASKTISLPLPQGGWWFGSGGWMSPGDWCRWLLERATAQRLARFMGGRTVAQLRRSRDDSAGTATRVWQALDAQGQVIAAAPVVVMAQALDTPLLLAAHPDTAAWLPDRLPLTPVRGQTSVLPSAAVADGLVLAPQHALAGAGYALSLPDGRVLTGATTQHDDDDPSVRLADHLENLRRAAGLGLFGDALREAPAHEVLRSLRQHCEPTASSSHGDGCDPAANGSTEEAQLEGRCGWRATTPDRLPLVGPLVDPDGMVRARATGARLDALRHLPRSHDAQGGLYVCTGLGSRGITSAVLAGELLAAWVTGAPFPVDADLRDALDPARFALQPPAPGPTAA